LNLALAAAGLGIDLIGASLGRPWRRGCSPWGAIKPTLILPRLRYGWSRALSKPRL